MPLIDFAIEVLFQPRYGQPPISGTGTETKGYVAVCDISIEILTFSYSAVSREYIRSFVVDLPIQCICMRSPISVLQPTPPLQLII